MEFRAREWEEAEGWCVSFLWVPEDDAQRQEGGIGAGSAVPGTWAITSLRGWSSGCALGAAGFVLWGLNPTRYICTAFTPVVVRLN